MCIILLVKVKRMSAVLSNYNRESNGRIEPVSSEPDENLIPLQRPSKKTVCCRFVVLL